MTSSMVKHSFAVALVATAWYICQYARLMGSEKAGHFIRQMLAHSATRSFLNSGMVFQIDGNLGGTAGIAEVLIQSHTGILQLLPALPAAFPQGYVRGLRIAGRRAVDIRWENGTMTAHRIYTVD